MTYDNDANKGILTKSYGVDFFKDGVEYCRNLFVIGDTLPVKRSHSFFIHIIGRGGNVRNTIYVSETDLPEFPLDKLSEYKGSRICSMDIGIPEDLTGIHRITCEFEIADGTEIVCSAFVDDSGTPLSTVSLPL